jgi:hypothetical protein
MYYRNAAAAIVCYDVTSPQSYQTMRFWLDELHRNIPAGSIVICIAATKTDLVPQVDLTEAEQMANSMGAMFVDTSAKTNTNVIGLFRKVAERVLQFKQDTPIPVTPGAAIDSNGNVLKKTPTVNRYGLVTTSAQVTPAPPPPKTRRDKRTKNADVVGVEKAPSMDITESKSGSSNVMCMDPYLCGQRDGTGLSCVVS